MEIIILWIAILLIVMYFIIEAAVKNAVRKSLNVVKEEIIREFKLKHHLKERFDDKNVNE